MLHFTYSLFGLNLSADWLCPPIYERENSDTAVDARELHGFLEVGKDFTTWVKDRIDQCGLVENQDFVLLTNFGEQKRGGHNRTDYALTIDSAKHISMIERNDKGKQARIAGRSLAFE